MILVTGFEPFGVHPSNPSEEIAKSVDGRVIGGLTVRAAILPVHHVEAARAAAPLPREHDALGVLHLGPDAGPARLAPRRVAGTVVGYGCAGNARHPSPR